MLGLSHEQKAAIGLDFVLRRLSAATPYGAEKISRLAPFARGADAAINRCFDNIDALMKQDLEDLRAKMTRFKNIRAILAKCEAQPLNEVELFEIKGFLLAFEDFLSLFNARNAAMQLVGITFAPMTAALALLDPQGARIAPFSIENGYSDTLAAIRHKKSRLEHAAACAAHTDEWKQITAAEDAEEMRIMADLSAHLRKFIPLFHANIQNLAELDLAMAKAALAAQYGAARPKISADRLVLRDMVNPMVAASLAENSRAMTLVTISLHIGVTIITGANMGGKSVAIKTAALNVALCALGLFVFAREAEIPLFDGIFLNTQDLQDTAHGLSSFGGEVARLSELAAQLPKKFLFTALDEPARATNPAEGAAIARGLARWLAAAHSISIIATHYDGITAPNARYYRVAGLADLPPLPAIHAPVRIADYMDYRLVPTQANAPIPQDALKICRLMGLCGLLTIIEDEYSS